VAAAGRQVTEPLLVKPSGERWRHADHFLRFRDVVTAVGQDPAEVSLYALRHTHITRQLLAGYKPTEVAQWHETSIAEIERHYARHLSSHAEPPAAPDYGPALLSGQGSQATRWSLVLVRQGYARRKWRQCCAAHHRLRGGVRE
jgi:hypothetical protein